MTVSALITLVILVAALVLMAGQRLRADLTALLVTLALLLAGILTPDEAFGAFGQPVIVIIAGIYVVGAALYETGVATLIANGILRYSGRGQVTLLLVIMVAAGALSALLSSLLVIAVLLPAVVRIARKTNAAASQFLLPLAAAATMGNLLTLIAAISNLVIGDVLVSSGQAPLGFFTLTPYGLVSLALAVLWYVLVGRHLLGREEVAEAKRPSLDAVERVYGLDQALYQVRVRAGSDLVGQTLEESPLGETFRLNVLAVRPGDDVVQPPRPGWTLEPDDLLVVEGARGDVLQAASMHHLEPKGTLPLEEFNRLEDETLRLAEVMVPFRSQLVGQTVATARFRERLGLNILAVYREGRSLREELPELVLAAGDTLLVQGPSSRLRRVGQDLDLILVTHLGPERGELITSKAGVTLAIVGVMLVAVITGLLPLSTAILAAALALVLTRCLSVAQAFASIDVRVIIILGGMLPLATALEKTGVAAWLAGGLAAIGQGMGPLVLLLLVYLVTALLSQVISNSVTGALMIPVAVNLAVGQGLPVAPFAVAVAVAVMASYVTPLTNGGNLLIRDPGRYTMRDYLVNTVPLFLLQTIVVLGMLSFRL